MTQVFEWIQGGPITIDRSPGLEHTGKVKILAGQNTDLLDIRLPQMSSAWAQPVKILAGPKPAGSKYFVGPKSKILAGPVGQNTCGPDAQNTCGPDARNTCGPKLTRQTCTVSA